MITKIVEPTFQTSDDKRFDNLVLAKEHELALLLEKVTPSPESPEYLDAICKRLVDESVRAIDILSTKPTSRVRARKVNGATKKRGVKPATEAAANLALK